MLAMRQALTTKIKTVQTVIDLGVAVLQEDELTGSMTYPAIIVAHDGKTRHNDSRVVYRERWAIYILAEPGDYYTIGKIADALQEALDDAFLPSPSGETTTGFQVVWMMDGPSDTDNAYKLHSQVQFYEIFTLQY